MKRHFWMVCLLVVGCLLGGCRPNIDKNEFLVEVKMETEKPCMSVTLALTQAGQILTTKRLNVDVNHQDKSLNFVFNKEELKNLTDLQNFAIQVYLFKDDQSESNWNLAKAVSVNGIIQFAPIYGRHYQIQVEGNNKQEYWSSWKEIKS